MPCHYLINTLRCLGGIFSVRSRDVSSNAADCRSVTTCNNLLYLYVLQRRRYLSDACSTVTKTVNIVYLSLFVVRRVNGFEMITFSLVHGQDLVHGFSTTTLENSRN